MPYSKPHIAAVQARVRQYEDHVRTGAHYQYCNEQDTKGADICGTVPGSLSEQCRSDCIIFDCAPEEGSGDCTPWYARSTLIGGKSNKRMLVTWYREIISRSNDRLMEAEQSERIVGTLTNEEIDGYLV